jgi:murein DD-endopeptidase MepM/ murein hydrolase activator NlpD
MSKSNFTIFLISNDTGKNRKFVIPKNYLRMGGFIFGIVLLGFVAASIDYVGLLLETSENKSLKAENSHLLKQFQVVQAKVSTLETNLERIKTFTTKLKLIANVESEDRQLQLSMPANPAPNQTVEEFDQPMETRGSLDDLKKQEQVFTADNPAETGGELVEESSRDFQSLAIRVDKSIKESNLREQSVLDLWESLSEKQSLMNSIPNIRPARGWITSKFGYRVSPFTGRPSMHSGLDIAGAPGTPIFSPADGVVSFSGYDEGYGKMVIIDHGYGYSTKYGHLSNSYVNVGQRIMRWDIVASLGNTGRSTGPHLHYEVRLNGVPKNPANFILDD